MNYVKYLLSIDKIYSAKIIFRIVGINRGKEREMTKERRSLGLLMEGRGQRGHHAPPR
jgi:hypothetical protein